MKKVLSFSFCLQLMVTGYCQTYVSGGIYTNTTWTVSNSPYIVVGTLTLFDGVTMTIEPGVEVRFDSSFYFDIRGTLDAIGTVSDSITITTNSVNPMPGIWVGLKLKNTANLSLIYCKISYAYLGLDCDASATTVIKHSLFSNNTVGFDGITISTIDSCNFVTNDHAIGLTDFSTGVNISHSTFTNNDFGIYKTARCTLIANVFCGNNTAAIPSQLTYIDGCKFVQNGIAIISPSGITIINSVIVENTSGITLHGGPEVNWWDTNYVHNNIICSNSYSNLIHMGNYNEDLQNNCWCTNDSTEIADKIYDGYDDIQFGLVDFSPVNNCDSTILSGIDLHPCNSLTAVEEMQLAENKILVYPNPFTEKVILNFPDVLKNENILTRIYNSIGQAVFESKVGENRNELNLSELPHGIFYIRFLNDSGGLIQSSKIIKR